MIKGLMGHSGITVSGGDTSVPYIPQNSENPIQGMIRIWGSDMQVFTGSSWQTLSTSYATASLTQDILDIVAWAKKKKDAEAEMQRLAETHPAIKLAVENLKKAQEQLEITTILSKENEKTTS